MNFTTPALLWALPAAAAPLLLHLLSRRRARRWPFPDMTLLRRVRAKALPRARLRQWLLVAARCGLLFFLILAYAGPVLEAGPGRGAATAAPQGLDLVLLLDASYSMGAVEGGRRRFDLAREAAAQLLRGLGASDRVAFGVFSDRLESAEPLALEAPAEALAALSRASLGFRGTDYAAALRAAYALPSETGRRRIILLLTDGAKHGLRGAWLEKPPQVEVYALSWEAPPPNSFLLSAGASADSAASKPRLRVRARAAAPGPLELWLEGRRVQSLALERPGESTVGFSLPPGTSWAGKAALRPDVLPADDEFYYSFGHSPRPRLLCLHGNPDFFRAPNGGYFLKKLFGPEKDSLLEYDADFLELGRLGEARLSDYAAVLLTDFKEVPPAAAARLESFVKGGGGLWVLPGGRMVPGGLSALPWLPAVLGAASASGLNGLSVEAGGRTFKLWKDFALERVLLDRHYELSPRPGAEVLLRSSSGRPLLAAGGHGRGRAAVWACPLETDWGNLALKPVFTAWVSAVLSLVSPPAEPAEALSLRVGEPVIRSWKAGEPAPASVRLQTPEGQTTTLWLKNRSVSFGETRQPGLYVMMEPGSLKSPRRYAVNADRSGGESDLSPLSDVPWKTLRAQELLKDFRLAVQGRDARPAALLAAAALLTAEMLLSLPRAAAVLLMLLGLAAPLSAQSGDRFVWTQLKLGATWNPYPSAPAEILELFSSVTSALAAPETRAISLKDPALFSSPLVILAGREAPPPLDGEELRNLRHYLTSGGMLWVEDTSGIPSSSFDRWLRRTLKEALPETELSSIPTEHAVYRSFFLLRGAVGRLALRATLEGMPWSGRMAVVYSRNDLLGLWVKDALGRPLLPCLPGGEPQRHSGRKLTLNILMYSLTGDYKSDAVHQPYLLQKMRSGQP